MAEHDLLSEICRSLGRIEQKVDDVRDASRRQAKAHETLDERVSFLEKCRMYDRGVVAGIGVVVSIAAWGLMYLAGLT